MPWILSYKLPWEYILQWFRYIKSSTAMYAFPNLITAQFVLFYIK